MTRPLVAWLVAIAAFGAIVHDARADRIDAWDVARAPDAPKVEQTIAAVESSLERATFARDQRTRHDLGRTALALLDDPAIASSHDPRIGFLVGRAYYTLDKHEKVVEVLPRAIERAPSDPDVREALFELAVSYAKLGRTKDEIVCYDRLLDTEFQPSERHTMLSNRGESKEKLGDAKGSIADLRASIEILPDDPLARWELAYTLDHAGDLAGAIEEAKSADDVDIGRISRLDSPSVFFVPEYSKYWRYALREAAKASKGAGARGDLTPRASAVDRQMHWDAAAANMATYLAHATSDDEWVPLARARMKTYEAQSARLKAEVERERAAESKKLRGRPPPVE